MGVISQLLPRLTHLKNALSSSQDYQLNDHRRYNSFGYSRVGYRHYHIHHGELDHVKRIITPSVGIKIP